MRPILILTLLAAACGAPGAGNQSGDNAAAPVQTADLTGLYEGGPAGARRNQLCMVRRGDAVQFGLVAWGENDRNCSGAGTAVRTGDRLRLTMSGDESCAIDAGIAGTRVTLPAALPAGCAYYCAPGAALAGASYDKVGGTDADAHRAVDLVGDPLCG